MDCFSRHDSKAKNGDPALHETGGARASTLFDGRPDGQKLGWTETARGMAYCVPKKYGPT